MCRRVQQELLKALFSDQAGLDSSIPITEVCITKMLPYGEFYNVVESPLRTRSSGSSFVETLLRHQFLSVLTKKHFLIPKFI